MIQTQLDTPDQMEQNKFQWGDISINIVQDTNHVGLGAVYFGDIELRNADHLLTPRVESPCGLRFVPVGILDTIRHDDGTVEIEFDLRCDATGPVDWMIHETRALRNLDAYYSNESARSARLWLRLKPIERTVARHRFLGFSYQYRYESPDTAIYQILDQGTWEVGGRATGNQIWMRQTFDEPIKELDSPQAVYTTERILPAARNHHMMQFIPLQTELQGFTFTVAEAGVLATWSPEVSHIRSLIESREGDDRIYHHHEHCGDLAKQFETSPMEVLFLPLTDSDLDIANIYIDMQEQVSDSLHRAAGMRRERISSMGWVEEWTGTDLDVYRETALPAFAEAGVKWFRLANLFENNQASYGLSNFCCTVDLYIADTIGEDAVARFTEAARDQGIQVEMWGNTALSTLNSLFYTFDNPSDAIRFPRQRNDSAAAALENVPDAFVRNPTGCVEADHYAPRFACLNLRSGPVCAWWLRRWGEGHDRLGLKGIFLDSSFNLSSDKFHWDANPNAISDSRVTTLEDEEDLSPSLLGEPMVLSQYHAHLALMGRMQQAGYRYTCEDHGVFGVHNHGLRASFAPEALYLWADCYGKFDGPELREKGFDPKEIFFRGLSHRVMWLLYWDPAEKVISFRKSGITDSLDKPNSWQLACLRAFDRVEDRMRSRRTILPDNRGVFYSDETGTVIWSHAPQTLTCEHVFSLSALLSDDAEATEQHELSAYEIYVTDHPCSIQNFT